MRASHRLTLPLPLSRYTPLPLPSSPFPFPLSPFLFPLSSFPFALALALALRGTMAMDERGHA